MRRSASRAKSGSHSASAAPPAAASNWASASASERGVARVPHQMCGPVLVRAGSSPMDWPGAPSGATSSSWSMAWSESIVLRGSLASRPGSISSSIVRIARGPSESAASAAVEGWQPAGTSGTGS
eukprot:scaffold171044_cov30-Tisochrysis_lutea.AAC.3